MRYGRIVFGIVGVLALVIGAGLLHRAGSQTQAEDPGTAQERALATAKRFLNTVGLPVPATDPTFKQLDESWRPRHGWEISWVGLYRLELYPGCDRVMTFKNEAREAAQVRGLGRTGRSIFSGNSEARDYLKKVAMSLGLPISASLSNLELAGDDEPGHGDANRAGIATATFVVHPRDYPFLHCGNGVTVSVDPQDGVLTYFAASWDNVLAPSGPALTPSLTRADAENAATGPYLKHRRPLFRRANAPTDAKLGWIVPNASYGSNHTKEQTRPVHVRLAWVVYFGAEAVFIDPYDGSVLGGLETKGMNRETAARFGGQRGSSPRPR